MISFLLFTPRHMTTRAEGKPCCHSLTAFSHPQPTAEMAKPQRQPHYMIIKTGF